MEIQSAYIEYLNKKIGFRLDSKTFKGKKAFEKAKEWGKENIHNFHTDMINIQFKTN